MSEATEAASPPEGFERVKPDLQQVAEGERKRRGRPLGSKNRKREQVDAEAEQASIRAQLALSLRSLFSLGGRLAGWFGYEADELTESEAEEGGRYFAALADRFPWLVTISVWVAGPAWLFKMIAAKFRAKKRAAPPPGQLPPPSAPAIVRVEGGGQG